MRAVEVAVTSFSVYFLIWFQAATANFTSSFQRIVTLDDLVHAHDTEFQTEVRSVLDCARLCRGHSYCVTFTYVTDDVTEEDVVPPKRSCRGYSTELTSQSGNASSVAGARTFRKIHQGTRSNVAVHKRATQSTTYTGHGTYNGFAHLAVDGNLNPDYFNGSCSLTTESNGIHWWQVDLAATFSVFSVTITNRGDCCADRFRDFDINIYSEDPLTNPIVLDTLCHHHYGTMGAGVTEDLPCYNAPISGRFVRVSMNGNGLALCEVQVIAVPFNE